MHKYTLSAFFLLLICCFEDCDLHEIRNVYNIPQIKDVVIDGKLNDWENKGFSLSLYANTNGEINKEDFQANVKIGWNKQGLWLACHVHDDSLKLSGKRIIDNDGLELFISKMPGTNQMLQYIIPAGKLSEQDSFRVDRYDFRSSIPTYNTGDIQVKTHIYNNNYNIEALIPLNELQIPCKADTEIALQLLFNDLDCVGRNNKKRFSWHYYFNSYLNNNALHRIKFVSKPTPNKAIPLYAVVNLVDNEYYDFKIVADSLFSGENISIKNSNQVFFSGKLKYENGLAITTFDIDASKINNRSDVFDIYLENELKYSIKSGEVNFIFKNKPKPIPARFEYDIRLYELRNAEQYPSENAILFLGSSSIRLWNTLASDFPNSEVVKCGFGGSRTEDIVYYFDRIVKPYPYENIVLFSGINDVNASVPHDTIIHNMKKIAEKVSNILPDCRILLLSNSVSVSKKHDFHKLIRLNQLYKELADNSNNVEYVDIFSPMLDNNGNIRQELFSADSTHMNQQGYHIWTKILRDLILN